MARTAAVPKSKPTGVTKSKGVTKPKPLAKDKAKDGGGAASKSEKTETKVFEDKGTYDEGVDVGFAMGYQYHEDEIQEESNDKFDLISSELDAVKLRADGISAQLKAALITIAANKASNALASKIPAGELATVKAELVRVNALLAGQSAAGELDTGNANLQQTKALFQTAELRVKTLEKKLLEAAATIQTLLDNQK